MYKLSITIGMISKGGNFNYNKWGNSSQNSGERRWGIYMPPWSYDSVVTANFLRAQIAQTERKLKSLRQECSQMLLEDELRVCYALRSFERSKKCMTHSLKKRGRMTVLKQFLCKHTLSSTAETL